MRFSRITHHASRGSRAGFRRFGKLAAINCRHETAPTNMARHCHSFGPQHPVLPEPVHLDLVVEDEKVIEARPSIGSSIAGLEKLAGEEDYVEFVYVAERICGILQFHPRTDLLPGGRTIMNIEVPPRARYCGRSGANSPASTAICSGWG